MEIISRVKVSLQCKLNGGLYSVVIVLLFMIRLPVNQALWLVVWSIIRRTCLAAHGTTPQFIMVGCGKVTQAPMR